MKMGKKCGVEREESGIEKYENANGLQLNVTGNRRLRCRGEADAKRERDRDKMNEEKKFCVLFYLQRKYKSLFRVATKNELQMWIRQMPFDLRFRNGESDAKL